MAGLFSRAAAASSSAAGAGLSGYGSSGSSDAQAESKRVTCGVKNERITDPSVLKRGDTIGVKGSGSSSGSRTGSSGLSMEYYHLGIYLGDDEVIDYVNDSTVRRIHLNEFTEDDTRPLYRIRYTDAPPDYEPKKITERAMEKYVNQDFGKYDVVLNNCEHFVTNCTFGKGFSFQVAKKVRSSTSGSSCVGM